MKGADMEPALVSCILPVYNGEQYLREAIDSVLAQTYAPVELIVVDDGSEDATAAVVESYGERLRYVRQANAGPAAARNRGIGIAAGQFIAFQDADDRWHAEKLSRQMGRFAARPELELCSAHVQNYWIPELKGEAEQFRNHPFAHPVPGYAPPSLLVRRDLFDTVGEFNADLRLSSDTDWYLRAVERGVVMEMLPDVLIYRRWHKTNISRTSRQKLVEVVKASLDRRRDADGTAPRTYEFPVSEPSRKQ
jgi:glycosyltransferase involved in cell wall biosynthesis